MKNATLFLFFLTALTVSAQQSDIKGVVSIHNSAYETGKRQYVQNAQVEDDFQKANAQVTEAAGTFTLTFVNVAEKASVQLVVKKEGLQIVNLDGLSAVAGQREVVRLWMAKPERIAEYRRELYKIGKTEAEKALSAQLKKKSNAISALQKEATLQVVQIQQLQKEYADLQAATKNIDEQAQDLARRYAPINLDDASPMYRAAFAAFQKGELEKSMDILRGADLIGQAAKMIEKETKANDKIKAGEEELVDVKDKKPQLLQALSLKADLHKTAFQFDSATACFELMLALDSTNVATIWSYAYFLANQRDYSKSAKYYNQLLAIVTSSDQKAIMYNQLGNVYRALDNFEQAKYTYQNALTLFKASKTKDSLDIMSNEALVLNNIGNLYRKDSLDKSEAAFKEALSKYRFLMSKNKNDYTAHLALTLNNIGRCYYEQGKITKDKWSSMRMLMKAGEAFEEALKMYEILGESNQNAVIPEDMTAFYDLNILFNDNDKESHILDNYSERLLNRALVVHRKLAKEKPEVFMPLIALTLLNIGDINGKKKRFDPIKTEQYYLDALTINKQMSAKNPYAFLPNLAENYTKLSAFYLKANKQASAIICTGHSQLLRGQYPTAKTTYEQLKGQKDKDGKDYKQMILDAFKALNAEGITHKDLPPMKAEIEKW